MAATPLAVRGSFAEAQHKVIPYDHAASFELSGVPGNVVPGIINIGIDGVFVATAIGYGLEEKRERGVALRDAGQVVEAAAKVTRAKKTRAPAKALASVPGTFRLGDVTLSEIPTDALIDGFRVTPNLGVVPAGTTALDRLFALDARNSVLERLTPPSDISFFFSIIDSNSGRELQDEPVHNLASLGKSNGERPFRVLPQPMSFAPRSTVRLQIIENSEGVRGTLFIVLYGYKTLAPGYCPEPVVRKLRGTAQCPSETIGVATDRLLPFDYVANLDLQGRPDRLIQQDVNINVDGGFVATALGYAMATDEIDVRLADGLGAAGLVAAGQVDLGEVPLSLFGAHLQQGVRIRPNLLRVALQDGGGLTSRLPVALVDKIFEPLNRPEDVSFRYTIFDASTGRELQNGLIHNVAGLGIANGDRPFKKFARPMIFYPRSAIRVMVQEHFGRGRLHLVFQGYKLPASPPRGVA